MPELIEVKSRKELLQFIKLPFELYREDPFFSPLPVFEQKKLFSPSKNPFFRDAEVRLFILTEGGAAIGRVASIINRRHLERHAERAGFFGFYESVNEAGAAGLLLGRAEEELKRAGLSVMRGPMDFSTNEQCGFLLEGFDTPPMLMTPHNPPFYNTLMESAGMRKSKDLLGYIYEVGDSLPPKVSRAASAARKRGIRARGLDAKRLHSELSIFREVYNDAWQDNWGFIPLTEEELRDMAARLKSILIGELAVIAQTGEGEPVGFMGLVPDFNQVLRKLGGKMINPCGLIKAVRHAGKTDALRLMLLGVKSKWRGKGVEALMFEEGFKGIKGFGQRFRRIEFSWILEDNLPMTRICEMIGGKLYKRYRIYEKTL